MRKPDPEDLTAEVEYLRQFLSLSRIDMNDSERLLHYFAAGFYRGIDWALEHKKKEEPQYGNFIHKIKTENEPQECRYCSRSAVHGDLCVGCFANR